MTINQGDQKINLHVNRPSQTHKDEKESQFNIKVRLT